MVVAEGSAEVLDEVDRPLDHHRVLGDQPVAEVVEEVAAREITLGRPAIPIAMNYSMLEVLMAKKLTNRKQRHIVAVADVALQLKA